MYDVTMYTCMLQPREQSRILQCKCDAERKPAPRRAARHEHILVHARSPVKARREVMPLPQTCEKAVPSPKDTPPVRSPQSVHSFIAERVAGRDLVEIGTRFGDGMACFTLYAKKATAIDINESCCKMLRASSAQIEAAHPGHGYSVSCSDYRTAGVLDADIITWWEQAPLDNIPALEQLLNEQRAGRVRNGAEAIVLFDSNWRLDMESWLKLVPHAAWSAKIPFNEGRRCVKMLGKSEDASEMCDRAVGYFVVAGFPISRMESFDFRNPTGDKKLLDQRRGMREAHYKGWDNVTDPNAWKLYEPEASRWRHVRTGSGHAHSRASHLPGMGVAMPTGVTATLASVDTQAGTQPQASPNILGVGLAVVALLGFMWLLSGLAVHALNLRGCIKSIAAPASAADADAIDEDARESLSQETKA